MMLYVHLRMQITAQAISDLLGAELIGDGTTVVNGPGTIEDAREGHITFLGNPKYEPFVYTTQASVILVEKSFVLKQPLQKVLIKVDNVYQALSILISNFSKEISITNGISTLASVHGSVTLGDNVSIDDFTIVKPNVKIGSNVKIHGQVFIGDNTVIGDHTILYPGVKIYHNCTIGQNCIIHANAIIGSDGFGFVKDDDGNYKKIDHIGSVTVSDNVEIGANTVIDRAVMSSTIIGKGSKLDNLIQIAHNVEIGSNSVVAAQSGIAGSVKVGDNCMIGGQVGIAGHLKIASGTMIQAQSGIASNIEAENSKLYGSPALDYSNYLKSYAYFKQLPELVKQLKAMQKDIINIKTQI